MNIAELPDWLLARLPKELAAGPPEIRNYDDELLIVLQLNGQLAGKGEEASPEAEGHAITEWREASRPLRMKLAREIQGALQRPVAWGIRVGSSEELFTSRTVPVMTRLNRSERDVLDTLVAAGVAETRSAALAYTVRAFATAHNEWLDEVGQAIAQVQQVRSKLKLRQRAGGPPDPKKATDS